MDLQGKTQAKALARVPYSTGDLLLIKRYRDVYYVFSIKVTFPLYHLEIE